MALALPMLQGMDPAPQANGRTRQIVQILAFVCHGYRADQGTYPVPEGGFVPAEFLRAHLMPVYTNRIVDRDGWARPLLYASDGQRLAIVSYGADGLPDQPYTTLDALQASEGQGDDIVWSGGHLVAFPPELSELEGPVARRHTMADLRSVGIAVEAYQLDRGAYPIPPGSGYQPVAFVRRHIEPTYIRSTPLMDAWGNTLLYWSDGVHYRVVSPGKDGTPDRPYDEVAPGTTTTSLEADLVYGDGGFLQGPAEDGTE
jgi:hypothetical protein